MKDVTDNIGVIIALGLPGFVLLFGLSYSSNEIAAWFPRGRALESAGSVAFLYISLASLALGMIISAIRWILVDSIINFFADDPKINFSKLKNQDVLTAFQFLVDAHYRYYQYYSHTLVAVLIAFVSYLVYGEACPPVSIWLLVVAMTGILFVASQDALKRYRTRVAELTS